MTATPREKDRLAPRYRGERFTTAGGSILAAVLGGLMFTASFDPYGLWPLLPIALGLLFVASYRRHWFGAATGGLVWGLAAFLPLFKWADIYAGAGPWIALATFEALFIALTSTLVRFVYVRRGISLGSHVGVAALWAVLEYVRANYPWGGLSWGLSAFAYGHSPLLNFGPWVGIVGLGAVSALLGTQVFAVLRALRGALRWGRNGIWAVWPASFIMAVLALSLVTPRPSATLPEGHQTLAIAAIQGNIEKPEAGSYYIPDTMFDNHVTVTRDFLDSGTETSLIVWPEDSTGWDVAAQPARMSILSQLSHEGGAPLLVGTQTPAGEGRYNKALLVDESGLTGQEYIKRHPVPFGEYIPERDVFARITDKVNLVPTDMVAGTQVGVMEVSGSKVGVLICFEIAYESSVRDTVMGGAEVLVVQSNTALFLDSYESIQQKAQARVYAVISGRSVVHAATAGHSAVFIPDGREIDSVDHWVSGWMHANVPLRTTITPAMRYHWWILAATCAVAAFALVGAAASSPRKDKETKQ